MHRLLVFTVKYILVPLLTTAIPYLQFSLAQNINVVKKIKIYQQQIKKDSNYLMIELKDAIPGIEYRLVYATVNNFTGTQLYRQDKATYARLPVVKALQLVQNELHQLGYGLKVFDAYRPYSVTKKMWELIKDERYVANPAKGSGHNRGLSLDLTIIELRTGKELDMGTGFDNFTDTAHHAFKDLPSTVLSNRLMLRKLMEKQGFQALETEWWHYSWPNDRNYEVMDIGFKKLKTLR
jgi:zinc D-Ala-D-Ala dipeptidase